MAILDFQDRMLAQVSEKRQMKKMYEKIILERPSSWLPSSWLHYTDALQNNLEMLHDWVQKNGDKSSETTLSDDLSKYKVLIINWTYFFFVTNFNSRQETTSVSRQMSSAFHLCNFPLKNIMFKIVKKNNFSSVQGASRMYKDKVYQLQKGTRY